MWLAGCGAPVSSYSCALIVTVAPLYAYESSGDASRARFGDAATARGMTPGIAREPITIDPARLAAAIPRRRNDVLFNGPPPERWPVA
jgi:hypothetical protein